MTGAVGYDSFIGPIKVEGSNRFVDNPDFDSGLYIQADKFAQQSSPASGVSDRPYGGIA
jgi:hypothetical protein